LPLSCILQQLDELLPVLWFATQQLAQTSEPVA
jgi:hypothetical protein